MSELFPKRSDCPHRHYSAVDVTRLQLQPAADDLYLVRTPRDHWTVSDLQTSVSDLCSDPPIGSSLATIGSFDSHVFSVARRLPPVVAVVSSDV